MGNKPNLLGISGKAGSGKDTVGVIIQYLTHCSEDDTTWDEWTNTVHYDFSNWKVKKFAYKVKQILSILTGIPIEDFEKEEVKNSYLREEWNRFRPIGYFEYESQATKLFASKEDAILFSKIYSTNEERGAFEEKITVRQAMQLVGTDLFRDKFHHQTWVNALFSDYRFLPKEKSGHKYGLGQYSCVCNKCGIRYSSENKRQTLCKECWNINTYPNWIITDVRFKNEAQAIKDRGGVLIRVNRKPSFWNDDEWTDKMIEWNENQHSSETELDDYDKFHYEIENNSDINSLIVKVQEILIKENIL